MKRRTFCAILPLAGALRSAAAPVGQAPRERLLFDHDWKFLRGDRTGAESPTFDAAAWRILDLPHDWSIEGKIAADNPMGGGGGYFPSGVAWYRKTFTAPPQWNGKRVSVEFEGVYMNATVYINGHDLGTHPYGYTSFFHDLTPHLKFGAVNVLAVRVDQSQQRNSRWYSGSGIYRHVWLHAANPVHVAPWGVSVTTPEVTAARATVAIQTRIANDSSSQSAIMLRHVVYSPAGAAVGRSEKAAAADHQIPIDKPALWSPESPNLYRVVTTVRQDGKAVDELSTTFGIRSIEWSAEKGFVLNGQLVKMAGGCIHHDNGPSAPPRSTALKSAACRSSNRPASMPSVPPTIRRRPPSSMPAIASVCSSWTRHSTAGRKARTSSTTMSRSTIGGSAISTPWSSATATIRPSSSGASATKSRSAASRSAPTKRRRLPPTSAGSTTRAPSPRP